MQTPSRAVTSNQTGLHPRLAELVARHACYEFRRPLAPSGLYPFEQAIAAWRSHGGSLIIDGGCGVGLSTRRLAQQFPDAFVIGIDQSSHRLQRQTRWQGSEPSNFITVRADLVDFWQRMALARIQPSRHYLLYPNPWPKKNQLQRRWHGHPIFPTLLGLRGHLECRSNWKIYIDEMASALTQLTGMEVHTEQWPVDPAAALTPFEQKYAASGHRLWRCAIHLPQSD
jgi:tRNA (guanine-N7-)-methyltransferase